MAIEEQLKCVFEEFYKVDDSRNDRSSTGLGLAICQRIIEKHGGSIWAESQGIGHGTTVHFTLPTIQGESVRKMQIKQFKKWSKKNG